MCKACESEAVCERHSGKKQRLKLWQVKPQYHCAILGTCLTMDDLRKVVRQAGITLEIGCTDYELHGTLVAQAEHRNPASHHMQKMLDRKFRRWIQTASALRQSAELEKFWDRQVREGEIAGPFWVLVTHPHADAELLTRAFGEVHMLSHLQGASNRADRQRLRQQVIEIDILNERLERLRRHHQRQLEGRDRRLQQQSLEIGTLKSRREITAIGSLDVIGKGVALAGEVCQQRLERAEERLAQRMMEIDRLRHETAALREMLNESQEEHAAMEQSLEQLLAARNSRKASFAHSIDLGGQRVLYVGGRAKLTPHLRSLVESSNGRFAYHDGGLEESRAGLNCSLAGADMVFCPVDCISHDACRRVKRYCRQQAKPFFALRSSGLSAFAAGLRLTTQKVEANSAERQLACTNALDQ